MREKKSTQIALGGVFSGLCLLLMFLSSMIPFSSFSMPMLAGAMLAAVVIENGEKTAVLVYLCVALLSIFVVPDLDTKLLFISFFGYYAILKPRLERLKSRPLKIISKLLIFNAAMVIGYFLTLTLFGLNEAARESEFLGTYAPLLTLAFGNVAFLLYDFLLGRYVLLYIHWFKPTFLRK